MSHATTPHRQAPHRSIGQRLERSKSRHALHDTALNWLKDWQAANDNLAIKQSLGKDVSLQCLDTNIKRTKALEGIFTRLFNELMAMPATSQEGRKMRPILLFTAGVLAGWCLKASFGQLAQCGVTDFDEQDRPTNYTFIETESKSEPINLEKTKPLAYSLGALGLWGF